MIVRASNFISLLVPTKHRTQDICFKEIIVSDYSDLIRLEKDRARPTQTSLHQTFFKSVDTYPYGVTVYKAKRVKNGYQKYPVPSLKDSLSGVWGRGSLLVVTLLTCVT
jgi:hypothetical protein